MQAGRALDALVAEKVMGLMLDRAGDRPMVVHSWGHGGWPLPEFEEVPRYSTDTAAAWLVVAHLTKHFHWRISSPFDPPHGETLWFAGLTPHSCTGWNGRPDLECGGHSAEEAICLVALKAAGVLPLEGRDVDSTLAALAADHA